MSGNAERNSAVVLGLLEQVRAGDIDEALRFVHSDYVEHTPTIGTDRAALGVYLRAVIAAQPSPRLITRHVIADDEHVVVHLHTLWGGSRPDTAAIDIFRLRDELIVEHWDVVAPLPPEVPARDAV